MNKPTDVYEMMLINPILRSTTIGQVRARARSSREKFARHEKLQKMNCGDAVRIYDRITAAEGKMLMTIAESNGGNEAQKAYSRVNKAKA